MTGIRVNRALATEALIALLVLAFTAVPAQVQPLSAQDLAEAFQLRVGWLDAIANVLGYVPLGMALAQRGFAAALGIAAAISGFAETTQLFSMGRSASIVDLLANVLGAAVGLAISGQWRVLPRQVAITPKVAGLAALLAIGYAGLGPESTLEDLEDVIGEMVAAPPWLPSNDRGYRSPGTLEASWVFDTLDHGMVADVSNNRVDGHAMHAPSLSPGARGTAVHLDGGQWIDFGTPRSLRLRGSMTISAWIRPASFPRDDTAIVSSRGPQELGYQLDTTVDEGARTIGFRLTDASGGFMARYGRTPLVEDRWYHVAGVYDAHARTLDVYLNGRSDNGCLRGTVTGSQVISTMGVMVGGRPQTPGFEFTGLIDEVNVYSRALSGPEIATEVDSIVRRSAWLSRAIGSRDARASNGVGECRDKGAALRRIAGPQVTFGMLVVIAGAGLWPRRRFRLVCVVLSCIAGLLLSLWMWSSTGAPLSWETPFLVLAGGVAVLATIRDVNGETRTVRRN